MTKLVAAEVGIVVGFAAAIAQSLIFSNAIIHFHQFFLNYYADGTADFSADVSALVRNLGIVNLLTLTFGVTIGAAIALTASSGTNKAQKGVGAEHLDQYERALVDSGLVSIAENKDGTTYKVTEHGRRFLSEYSFLQRRLEQDVPQTQETPG